LGGKEGKISSGAPKSHRRKGANCKKGAGSTGGTGKAHKTTHSEESHKKKMGQLSKLRARASGHKAHKKNSAALPQPRLALRKRKRNSPSLGERAERTGGGVLIVNAPRPRMEQRTERKKTGRLIRPPAVWGGAEGHCPQCTDFAQKKKKIGAVPRKSSVKKEKI